MSDIEDITKEVNEMKARLSGLEKMVQMNSIRIDASRSDIESNTNLAVSNDAGLQDTRDAIEELRCETTTIMSLVEGISHNSG